MRSTLTVRAAPPRLCAVSHCFREQQPCIRRLLLWADGLGAHLLQGACRHIRAHNRDAVPSHSTAPRAPSPPPSHRCPCPIRACKVVLGHLTGHQVLLLRVENRVASWPFFSTCAPLEMPQTHNSTYGSPSSSSAHPCVATCGSHHSAKLTGGPMMLPHVASTSESHHTAKSSGAQMRVPHIATSESDHTGRMSGAPSMILNTRTTTRTRVGAATSNGLMQRVAALISTQAAAGQLMLADGQELPLPSSATAPGAAVGSSDRPAAPSPDLMPPAHQPAFEVCTMPQWTEIVELVRQCWELELEARPSAASLQARAKASLDCFVGQLPIAPELASDSSNDIKPATEGRARASGSISL